MQKEQHKKKSAVQLFCSCGMRGVLEEEEKAVLIECIHEEDQRNKQWLYQGKRECK